VAIYKIERVQDTTYLDPRGGQVVSGFAVTFTALALDETHTVDVPSNDPKVVDERVRAEIAKLEALHKLGA